MLVALSVLMMSPGAWDDPAPKGRWAAPTAKLAADLLPADMARDVVAHRIARGITSGGDPLAITFEGRGRPTSDGFCVRRDVYVGLLGGKPNPPTAFEKIRMGDCVGQFAGFNGTASLDQAKQTLRWMAWARDQAAGAAPLPFAVDCRDETIDADRCTLGARHALMMLPLEKTFIMEKDRDRPHVWRVAVAERGPGQLFWNVTVDGTPGKARIALAWKVPAPF